MRQSRSAQDETPRESGARYAQVAAQVQRYSASRRPLIPNHDTFNEGNVAIHSCGAMNVECQFCHSLNFHAETSTDNYFKYCCHKGTVLLEDGGQLIREFPPVLRTLLSNQEHPLYRHFKDNIRSYNSALSFASMGAQIDVLTAGKGPYVFKVHGQIYHLTGHQCILLIIIAYMRNFTSLTQVWQMNSD